MPRGVYPRPSVDVLFWKKVQKTDSCWLWTGATVKHGRGQMTVNGRHKLATHVSWEIHVGPVPAGKRVLHVPPCNLPACVRPEHLYLGTEKENRRDFMEAGWLHWRDGRPWKRSTCRFGHPLRMNKRGQYCSVCHARRQRERQR